MKTDNDYCVPKKVRLIYDKKAVINVIKFVCFFGGREKQDQTKFTTII